MRTENNLAPGTSCLAWSLALKLKGRPLTALPGTPPGMQVPRPITLKRVPMVNPGLNGAKISRIWSDLLPRRGYRTQPKVSTP
jgi:hypothetical protein